MCRTHSSTAGAWAEWLADELDRPGGGCARRVAGVETKGELVVTVAAQQPLVFVGSDAACSPREIDEDLGRCVGCPSDPRRIHGVAPHRLKIELADLATQCVGGVGERLSTLGRARLPRVTCHRREVHDRPPSADQQRHRNDHRPQPPSAVPPAPCHAWRLPGDSAATSQTRRHAHLPRCTRSTAVGAGVGRRRAGPSGAWALVQSPLRSVRPSGLPGLGFRVHPGPVSSAGRRAWGMPESRPRPWTANRSLPRCRWCGVPPLP